MAIHEKTSLYERLGGVYPIATVVDDLIDRILSTPDSTRIHASTKPATECWDAFLDDLQQSLDKFGVPGHEQDELKEIVRSVRADVVV